MTPVSKLWIQCPNFFILRTAQVRSLLVYELLSESCCPLPSQSAVIGSYLRPLLCPRGCCGCFWCGGAEGHVLGSWLWCILGNVVDSDLGQSPMLRTLKTQDLRQGNTSRHLLNLGSGLQRNNKQKMLSWRLRIDEY